MRCTRHTCHTVDDVVAVDGDDRSASRTDRTVERADTRNERYYQDNHARPIVAEEVEQLNAMHQEPVGEYSRTSLRLLERQP